MTKLGLSQKVMKGNPEFLFLKSFQLIDIMKEVLRLNKKMKILNVKKIFQGGKEE